MLSGVDDGILRKKVYIREDSDGGEKGGSDPGECGHCVCTVSAYYHNRVLQLFR